MSVKLAWFSYINEALEALFVNSAGPACISKLGYFLSMWRISLVGNLTINAFSSGVSVFADYLSG